MKLEVQELDVLDGGDLDHRLMGATFEDIPLKQRSNRVRGVLLTELDRESRLARRGMRPGQPPYRGRSPRVAGRRCRESSTYAPY